MPGYAGVALRAGEAGAGEAEAGRGIRGFLVPTDTPGFQLVRAVSVMGHAGGGGHCEIIYKDCRVPVTNLLGEEGSGFAIAQARLGPGRIHHCMRMIGVAERSLEAMVARVKSRTAFGRPLADQGVIREWIADSRMEIEQAQGVCHRRSCPPDGNLVQFGPTPPLNWSHVPARRESTATAR